MVKVQKPIPKKLEKKPKLDNPIKQKKQEQKKEKPSKKAKLLDDSTPVKEAKLSQKKSQKVVKEKQNKSEQNGKKKGPLIPNPEASATVQKQPQNAAAQKKKKQKQKNPKSEPEAPTPVIEKIKKVQEKPKIELQKKKKAKIAFTKMQRAAKAQGKTQKKPDKSSFRFDPVPYDEERFNSIVNFNNIKKIALALKPCVEKEVEKKKSTIFNDYRYFLQIGSYKIGNCPKRMVRLNLKHSLVDKNDDILLVVPDLKRGSKVDYEPTKQHYEDYLRQNGVEGITVMPMNQLKKEHTTFDAKRKLMASYEYFMVDGRISGHVTSYIGKFTQKTRTTFHAVRLNENKDIKAEIEKSLKKTSFRQLGKNSSQTVAVGTDKFTADQLADNILLVISQLKEVFPGGLGNIRSLHLRIGLSGTSSLPLFLNMGQAPEETPNEIGQREKKMLKLKKDANEVLSQFTMNKDGKLIKLSKNAVEKKKQFQEAKAALIEEANNERKAKGKVEKTKKKKATEAKELELPENEDDDESSDDDDEGAVEQGSDDETEDDEMANLEEDDTESGGEVVMNGFVGEDDEESEDDDDENPNESDDDEDDDEDDDDGDDDDEDEESD